ncbi:MAG: NAD(P)-dependent oxidoreductase [Bacillota bacterium]|nr:NAD(P)-dependent oxidoreductase [Bacillota bacterium]
MNILITGADHGIGKYLTSSLKSEHKIYDFSMDNLDVTKKSAVLDIIANISPNIVIHAESMDNIDSCEANETDAYTINTIGTLNVAHACSLLNIPIFYMSTSSVYGDSKNTPYYETDECNPVNVYGKTKLAGEKLIRTVCSKFFILRIGWLFGDEDCFVKKIIKNKNIPVFVCSDEIGNPTYIEDLSNCINVMMNSNLYGIYNCASPHPITKSHWVQGILNNSGVEKSVLELPQNFLSLKAQRPKYSAVSTIMLKNCFNLELPNWEESLKKYMELIK